jgi:predicted metal-dependent phosphoesterase TrpH
MSERISYAITHAHSWETDGMVAPRRVVQAAKKHGVRLLALTDHDTMDGTIEARDTAADLNIQTIVGIEVTTYDPHHLGGALNPKHVIGLFPSTHPIHVIPDSKPIGWVLDNIHDQGGVAIIAHPGGSSASWSIKDIPRLASKYKIDGIEVINGMQDQTQELEHIINDFGLAEIGASDSHFGHKDIGTAFTQFPGTTAEDFFKAIRKGTTKAVQGTPPQISRKDIWMQHGRAWVILGGRRYFLRNLRRLKTIPPEA